MKSLKISIIISLVFSGIIFCIGSAYPANTATQIDFILNGLNDTKGNPLSGGKIEVYSAGLTTGKNVWSDKNKTTVLANGSVASGTPIKLDTYGKKLCYGDGWYKFTVKNSADVTLFTVDNIYIGNRDGSRYDVSDYNDLGAAVTAIASNNAILEIRSNVSVGTNTTIPSNITVEVSRAGKFTKSGATLTINGNLDTHDGLIFDGFTTTDITLNPLYVKEVHPQWWGFATTASEANNLTYLTAAINAGVQDVVVPSGSFPLDAFTINKSVSIRGVISKDNESTKETIFTNGDAATVMKISGTVSVHLSDFQIQSSVAGGSEIDIEGNADNVLIERLWIENTAGGSAGQYGIRFNASGGNGDIENPIIDNCVFVGIYYNILHNDVSGTGRVIKLIVRNCKMKGSTNVYEYYDPTGQGYSATIQNNEFNNFTKLGIYFGSSTGMTIVDNRFDIGSNSWDTFTGAVTTRNPILCGTTSSQITAFGNTFVSGDTETNARGKLFKHLDPSQGKYLFIDPYDGIYADVSQRYFGGFLFKNNIDTTGETIRVQTNNSQTADLLQFQNGSTSAVLSGINAYGNKYNMPVTVTASGGSITCNLANGNVFYYTAATSTSQYIEFSNHTPDSGQSSNNVQVKLLFVQGASGATHTVTWANNIYGTSAVSTAVAKRDLYVYDYFNQGSATGWFANSITKGM